MDHLPEHHRLATSLLVETQVSNVTVPPILLNMCLNPHGRSTSATYLIFRIRGSPSPAYFALYEYEHECSAHSSTYTLQRRSAQYANSSSVAYVADCSKLQYECISNSSAAAAHGDDWAFSSFRVKRRLCDFVLFVSYYLSSTRFDNGYTFPNEADTGLQRAHKCFPIEHPASGVHWIFHFIRRS